MTLIIALVAAPFVFLTVCFALEVFVGLKPIRRNLPIATNSRAAIIVPAHNEEAIIGRTLPQLKASAGRARVVVIADNCTDRTAEIARTLGAEVFERFDTMRRGKGYALDYGRECLRRDPPDVVCIIDADCTIDRLSLVTLIAACEGEGKPCQATNLQRPQPHASVAVQLSTFAFFVKNVIRERALQRLCGRVHLLGTGMALPWSIFDQATLATADIVEDLKLGLELSRAGFGPVLIEAAQVWSNAESDGNTLSQRRRWEGGFMANALSTGPVTLVAAFRSGDLRAMWAAIDLMIPPFALLISIDFAVLVVIVAVAGLYGSRMWPASVLALAIAIAIAALFFAWLAGGSAFIRIRNLVRAPIYLLWKMPMYIGLAMRGPPKDWKRTDRS